MSQISTTLLEKSPPTFVSKRPTKQHSSYLLAFESNLSYARIDNMDLITEDLFGLGLPFVSFKHCTVVYGKAVC